MIDAELKQKLLEELEKDGNVYVAAKKVGIHRSTIYRWEKEDRVFKKSAAEAIRHGKKNNCGIANHALMIKVAEKDMKAITYYLSHNDPVYKPKHKSDVVIWHKKDPIPPTLQPRTLEDILNEYQGSDIPDPLPPLHANPHGIKPETGTLPAELREKQEPIDSLNSNPLKPSS